MSKKLTVAPTIRSANVFGSGKKTWEEKTGDVVYKAEKDACRAFPDPHRELLESGVKRNYQIPAPLDFLAECTQHIPPKGAHLVRYYGWYSNKLRGMRRKRAEGADMPAAAAGVPAVWRGRHPQPDLGHAHRAAARRRDREYPSSLWIVAGHPRTDRSPPSDRSAVYGAVYGADELAFVPDLDCDREPPSCDVPWEMACDARFYSLRRTGLEPVCAACGIRHTTSSAPPFACCPRRNVGNISATKRQKRLTT